MKHCLRWMALTCAGLLLALTPVAAQTQFKTPTAGSVAQGVVIMCLDGSSQAVPATAAGTCLGSGGGGGSTITGPLGSQTTAASVATTINGALPAGTAILGKVGIDQTTPGTTNGVQLTAGTAIAGKVGIDQTTPGTTNAVSATNFPTTVSVNTGATGASSPRVTVAGDTATIAGSAPGTAQSLSANVLTTAAPTSNFVSGTANVANTASTSLIALVASNRIYITSYSCSNSGSSATIVSFQDGNGGTTVWTAEVPAGGGHVAANGNFPMFRTTSGTALYFASGTSSTTVYCSAAGFSGG